MTAHDIASRLVVVFTEALADEPSVQVFDGPAGVDVTATLAVGVGVSLSEPGISVTPTPVGAATGADDDVRIRCVLMSSVPVGSDITEARAIAAAGLVKLTDAIGADMTLDGTCSLANMTGIERYWQNRTPDQVIVEVAFEVQAMVYR